MRRWIRAVDVAAIVLGAKLCAGTANAVIRASLTEPAGARPAAAAVSIAPPPPPFSRYDAIVERNVFNHGEAVPGEIVEEAPEAPPEACNLPLQVLAVVFVPEKPELSIATFLDRGEAKPRILAKQVGEEVGIHGTVRRAWMDGPDAAAEIQTPEGRVVLCRSSDEKTPAVAFGRSTGAAPAATGKGIKKITDTQYEVAQAEVDAVMAGGLMNEARNVLVVPYFENGKATGFKLARVKSASLLSKIGLMSGDIVRRINGYEINTPEKALQVYALLKNEKRISVDVTRAGSPKTLNYVIR